MRDPSAVYAMEKYENYSNCVGKHGTFGIVLLPDGKYYEAWYVYYKETNPEYFEEWIKNRFTSLNDPIRDRLSKGMQELKEGQGEDRPDWI